ncbi:MAG: MraY family glycosyltransferase [Burkholderiales bacterium]
MMNFILPIMLAFGVTFILLLIMLNAPLGKSLLDRPNERSLHQHPVPRIGGLAIMLGIAGAWLAAKNTQALLLLAVIAPLIAISVLDDFNGVAPLWRLLVQLAVAALALANIAQGTWPWGAYAGALIMLVWGANLYNFMDGSDGLAGGMAVFGFGGYALAAVIAGNFEFAALTGAIVAAALAFLVFNFNPARVFMGDAGSVPLGFLAALLGIAGIQAELWPIWFPFLVFSPFVVDATVTLVKRARRGETLWQAHRDHYYQRLVRMGLGHRGTALVSYVAMLISMLTALLARDAASSTQWMAASGIALAYALGLVYVDRRWREFETRAA